MDLAIDVLGSGIAGTKPIGGQNAGDMGLQGFAQPIEGFQSTAPTSTTASVV
jgi:hypothetical protein